MLSGETAIGDYPVEAVACHASHRCRDGTYLKQSGVAVGADAVAPKAVLEDPISVAACDLMAKVGATAIVAPTLSGRTARPGRPASAVGADRGGCSERCGASTARDHVGHRGSSDVAGRAGRRSTGRGGGRWVSSGRARVRRSRNRARRTSDRGRAAFPDRPDHPRWVGGGQRGAVISSWSPQVARPAFPA